MRANTITFKLLSLIISSFVVATGTILLLATNQLTRIIDQSQNEVYAEKIAAIKSSLARRHERLKQTGLVEAYVDDFKQSSLEVLRQTYYDDPDQPVYPFIIDDDGKVVMHPLLASGDLSLEQTAIVRQMLAAQKGNFTTDFQGREKWYLFEHFPEWNWVIGYTVPLDLKYADARTFGNLLIMIMGGITFVVLVVLSFSVTRFTRPIIRLTEVASAMADGRLDQRIDPGGGTDEIGMLARSFIHMRDAVRETISALQKENAERRRTEQALAESEELYRSLVENINMGITLVDQNHTIIMANTALGKMFNRNIQDFYGKKCFQVFEKRNTICPPCPGMTAMQTGLPEEIIRQEKREDGSSFTVKVRAFPLTAEDGSSKGFIEVVEDITEQLEIQQDLAAEKERLAVTLRSIADGVITTDIIGNVALLNRVAENLTGWSSSEAVGRPLQEVFHIINRDSGEVCDNPVAEIVERGRVVGPTDNTVLVCRDGRQWSIAESGAPILDGESNIIGVVLVFRDVTKQIKTEKELLKIKKLESIGVLAGGIAHDFNNILAAIVGNLDLALIETGLNDNTRKLLAEAEKASLRARDLTQQLLTFAKGGEPVRETSSLAGVIRDSAEFVLHGDNVACSYDIPENLWLVDIDRGQISQVIQNIVLNARHAMPEGGSIHIACRNIDPVDEEDNLVSRDTKYVQITIRDNGIGIPAKLVDKIFDPYFTTKQEGSGLGLAISHSIIMKHGGRIAVKSTPGSGTAFTFYIPASEEKNEADAGGQIQESSRGKQAKIMIMDDEKMVRDVAAAMLTEMGHEVFCVQDGAEALAVYGKESDAGKPFDIVIMDLTIPGGMGGKDAVRELLALDPEARVIVSSGYSNDPIMANCRKYGFRAAVVKPYQMQELVHAVNQLLIL